MEEDPSLRFEHNHETGDMVLWGQGEMHLRVALERLEGKFGVPMAEAPRALTALGNRNTHGKVVVRVGEQ